MGPHKLYTKSGHPDVKGGTREGHATSNNEATPQGQQESEALHRLTY